MWRCRSNSVAKIWILWACPTGLGWHPEFFACTRSVILANSVAWMVGTCGQRVWKCHGHRSDPLPRVPVNIYINTSLDDKMIGHDGFVWFRRCLAIDLWPGDVTKSETGALVNWVKPRLWLVGGVAAPGRTDCSESIDTKDVPAHIILYCQLNRMTFDRTCRCKVIR